MNNTKEGVEVNINGQPLLAKHKVFKTGRTGFGLYDKIIIDGCTYQISLNIIKLK